ncbi:MAG: peptidoglycan editing factor PgeF [Candidatus Cloacimonadaceae bacterium]|nr:peptidoglycan editing factor PgeF [Candidatus Cloacimonadaceae bacterium]
MSIFYYLGDKSLDYRGIMHRHDAITIDGTIIDTARVVVCEQTHSDIVHICTEADAGAGFGSHPQIEAADGLICNVPALYLLIRTADCTPVLFYDEKEGVVGAVHSGREGTRKNICVKAVKLMQSQYGCEPDNIHAIIGAGICPAHYEVSEDIWQKFYESLLADGIAPVNPVHRHPDIQDAIYTQLLQKGLRSENIVRKDICTYEAENYFSYRRDGTRNRQINLIGVLHV